MSKRADEAQERYAGLKGIERVHKGRDGEWMGLTPEMRTRKAPYCAPIPDWSGDLRAAVREATHMPPPEYDGGAGGGMPMEVRIRVGHILGSTATPECVGAEAVIGTAEHLRTYGEGTASLIGDGCTTIERCCALAVTRAMIRVREGE